VLYNIGSFSRRKNYYSLLASESTAILPVISKFSSVPVFTDATFSILVLCKKSNSVIQRAQLVWNSWCFWGLLWGAGCCRKDGAGQHDESKNQVGDITIALAVSRVHIAQRKRLEVVAKYRL
jgi:hypothetical protein